MRLGYMVSLADIDSLVIPEADFAELLLFDGDLAKAEDLMELSRRASGSPPIEFVHVQEFVTHDGSSRLLDLASEDEPFRQRCVEIVMQTRALAESLGCLPVVIHPGGIRPGRAQRQVLLGNLRESLMELGREGLLLENMPWFYWYRKQERMLANICVSVEDMARFSSLVEGFTLDVCHGFLSRPDGDPRYLSRFFSRLGNRTRHIHVSDAAPPDREGLQIGDGVMSFSELRGLRLPTLVEIWRGHENEGAGFRLAIERLRAIEERQPEGQK